MAGRLSSREVNWVNIWFKVYPRGGRAGSLSFRRLTDFLHSFLRVISESLSTSKWPPSQLDECPEKESIAVDDRDEFSRTAILTVVTALWLHSPRKHSETSNPHGK